MNALLIDAGNSSLKWALYSDGHLAPQESIFYYSKKPIDIFKQLLDTNIKHCKKIVMVSVLGKEFNEESRHISEKYALGYLNIQSTQQLLNITNAYAEPHKLGADRLVAMVGAHHLINRKAEKKKACIIVDSGTATTIDAVDEHGHHLGGLILPGSYLCSSSLLKNTQLLAKWNKDGAKITPSLFATETTEAIASASIFGLAGAIDKICEKMGREITQSNKNIEIEIILCGGSSNQLLPYLELNYQQQENLLMIGLSLILDKSGQH